MLIFIKYLWVFTCFLSSSSGEILSLEESRILQSYLVNILCEPLLGNHFIVLSKAFPSTLLFTQHSNRSSVEIIVYLILFVTLVVTYHFIQIRHNKKKLENKRLKEMVELRTRFYHNLAHELRTPLTLILGPTQNTIDNITSISNSQLQKNMDLVMDNSKRLLQLINQLLDLSKLEGGYMKAEPVFGNIISYIDQIKNAFLPAYIEREVDLNTDFEKDQLFMDFDRSAIHHILSNLLSNALKFTSKGDWVNIKTKREKDQFILTIEDSGKGIPDSSLSNIFDRYYQSDDDPDSNGTGIGLSLTKGLVEMLGGRIEVYSEFGKGTNFQISLQITKNHKSTVPIKKESGINVQKEALVKSTLVLVVEDNQEIADYIDHCINNENKVVHANNGKEGQEIALDLIPDIIICDVVMPFVDGLTLCQNLKNDIRTSHIPIILLTSKAGRDDRMEGLKSGADAYLVKPFDERELKIRIRKTLELRRKLQVQYQYFDTHIKEDQLTLEDVFIKNIKNFIESNLYDQSLDIHSICKEMGLSRSQLHRKIVALTGKSASKLVNHIRLDKAKEKLKDDSQTISQVAYSCGYTDPNYFSRLFKARFSLSPSEYRTKKN